MSSLRRSVRNRLPAASKRARSPVCSQPSESTVAAVAAVAAEAEHELRAADPQLARAALPQRDSAVGIDDHRLRPRHQPPDRSVAHRVLGQGDRAASVMPSP